MLRGFGVAFSIGLAAGAAAAQASCRLALVLAMDVSSSVDTAEDRLQRQGLAAALTAPDVQAAILSEPGFPVALYVFEWSGRYQHNTVLGWRLLTSPDDIADAAAAISESTRRYANFPTALGYALGHAVKKFDTAPACERRTIDVSGDGRNNAGFGPQTAYRHFPFQGVTVNGLAIGGIEAGLPTYYRTEVAHGPGAFVELARDFDDFERAMERKLIRETATPDIGQLRLPAAGHSPAPAPAEPG